MDAELKLLLAQLSAKLDTVATKDDIAQLRAEMRAGDEALRAEMKAGDESLRAEMRVGFAGVAARFEKLEKIADVAEVKGRVEEQSKMLQLALGARMSRPPAA